MKEDYYQKGIINLIVVMSIGLFALGAALVLSIGLLGEVKKNRNTISGDRTFYAAESGMVEGSYQYFKTSSYGGGIPIPINNTLAGLISVTDLGWPYVAVEGEADNLNTKRIVLYTINLFPEGFAFDHAVYAHNELTLGGSIEVNGSIFANDEINFLGNNATVNGDAFSPQPITDTDNINGNVVSGVEPVPIPDIDFQPYADVALIEGTYFINADDAESYLNDETRNAVVFVNDSTEKTKIQGANTNLTGSLVVRGDLDITGGTYTATNNYLAVIVEGDLKIAGGVTINGIVYAKGNTTFGGGNNTINGALISGGEASFTDLTGNVTINYDPVIAQTWQDLTGLDTVSSLPPKIILWNEQ